MIYDIKNFEGNGFKSKLEFIASMYLTKELGLTTYYEPETVQLKNQKYTPDFYCPEIKTWFECKPSLEFVNADIYKEFVILKNEVLVVLTPTAVQIFEEPNVFTDETGCTGKNPEDQSIVVCDNCGKVSFCNTNGFYYCRACDHSDGDHWRKDLNEDNMYTFMEFYLEVAPTIKRCYL